jgi:hypothetical protein
MPLSKGFRKRIGWSFLIDRRISWIAALSWLALAVALVRCFRSDGRHRHSIYLALLIPCIRLFTDSGFRERIRRGFQQFTSDIRDYSRDGMRFPFAAIAALVMVPVAILNLSSNINGGNGDTWPVMATSSSIVREGNVDVSEYLSSYIVKEPDRETPYCVTRVGERSYSIYPAGMNVFAVPVCAVARMLGSDLSSLKGRSRLEKWSAAWVAALCSGLFFAIALRLSDPRTAAIATIFFASGSAMLSTVGHAMWQHGGVILWSLLALLLEFHAQNAKRNWVTLLQGAALGMALSCRLSAGLIVGAMGLWIGLRSIPRGLVLGAGIALGALPWALFYTSVYGSPFGPSEIQMAHNLWDESPNLIPVLFSPGAGLLVYQPWIGFVALLPALWFVGNSTQRQERSMPRGWMLLCGSIVVMQIVLVARWRCWWGGSCWGSRLCSEAIPFAALLCVPPIAYIRERRWGMALLLVVGIASAFVQIYVNYFEQGFYRPDEDLLNWSRAPFITNFPPQ